MSTFLVIILIYMAALTIMNFWKSRKVKSQDDMMLAGRQIPISKMIFTLICTWIGSGTFISGAEFAAKAGWSAMWQVGGVGVGIIIIYFLASKIRTFGQYTVGDILETRYGPVARIFGAVAIIISFTTIVSYQFKAGGYILNIITDGKVSTQQGVFFAFLFVTVFTMIGGMVAIANTDLPNGIVILTALVISTPLVIIKVLKSGLFKYLPLEQVKRLAIEAPDKLVDVLPETHRAVFNPTFTYNPPLKILAMGISTMLLLLGVQSLYQKFYSARNPQEARKAAGIWMVGTLIIESVAIIIAVFATAYFANRLFIAQPAFDHAEVIIRAAREMIPPAVGVLLLGAATVVVISTGMNYLLSPTTTLIRDVIQRFFSKKKKVLQEKETKSGIRWPLLTAATALLISFFLPWFKESTEAVQAGPRIYSGFAVGSFLKTTAVFDQGFLRVLFQILVFLIPVGALLIICLVLLRRKTEIASLIAGLFPFIAVMIILFKHNQILDQLGIGVYLAMVGGLAVIIYRTSLKIDADNKAVLLQKFLIVLIGVFAYLMATQMRSVMENALFAYTIYGVAITPPLIAALAWKRVTKAAGLVSIISATIVTISLKLAGSIWPSIMKPAGDPNADPFGIPILYPALAVALLSLFSITFLTKKPSQEELNKFFPKEKAEFKKT
ncbi:MAG: sodium:solute symporter family protein [Candidatus Aminicenantes bacterium]|nr:sodium:solute symporter family protein [Candidatus Aminicenantes bacterium]